MKKLNLLDYTKEDLIITNMKAKNNFEVLKMMGNLMYQKGYVNKNFVDAIISREKDFPTGLKSNGINIAIPHADSKYVISPAIAVATLENEVHFNRMDYPEQKVPVKIVFMLAVKNPDEQLSSLQELVEIVKNYKLLEKMCKCNLAQDLHNILKNIESKGMSY